MWPLYPHVTYVYVCVLSGAALTRIKLLFNRHVALVTVSGLLPWFHYYCAAYDECKYSDTFWLADRVHLFVHYTIALTSLCKLIWGHWNYKMPVRYIFSSLWVRLSILPQLSIIQYMGLCVFSLPISLVMIERIYTLSYYHNQIGSINYYPLFRVRSWNNGMRCMSLFILMVPFLLVRS